MFILYVLTALLVLLVLCILFLGICALAVDPQKEYEKNSPFYRFLLDSTTALAMVLLRIKVHITGFEKLPTGEKVLFVGNHRSNFDPIITWYALKDQKADAPVAVISITGTENIRKNIPFRKTDVYLDVLEVIPAENIKNTKTELIGKAVRHLVETNIEKRKHG